MAKQSARPAVETSEAFRETFLFLFDPEDAKVFRQFIQVVEERLDRSTYSGEPPHVSYTVAEMLAVVADLSYLETFLERVAAERSLSELKPTERSLADLAERLAPQVAALASGLAQEIEHLLGDDGNDEDDEDDEDATDGLPAEEA